MTANEIERDMKKFIGCSFITKRELATYLGYKKTDSIENVVKGLKQFNKKYFVPEVAERIIYEIE